MTENIAFFDFLRDPSLQDHLHNIIERIPHPETGEPVFSRFPKTLWEVLGPVARKRMLHGAGCELRFRLGGPKAMLRFRATEVDGVRHGGNMAQILMGDFSSTYFRVDTNCSTIEIAPPNHDLLPAAAVNRTFSPELVRVLFPTYAAIAEVSLEGDILPPEPGDVPGRRLLAYGSSITQGAGGLSSRESWVGMTAHRLGMDLLNLGLGGSCRCEPEVADYLAGRRDWDVATLEIGVNMLNLDEPTANRRVVDLITRVASAHKDKWIFCLGVFPCADDITMGWGGRARAIHELVRQTVSRLALPKLCFLDGAAALRPALDMTVDLTHPSPAGMISIGKWAADGIGAVLRANGSMLGDSLERPGISPPYPVGLG